jgi:hypothetical protein
MNIAYIALFLVVYSVFSRAYPYPAFQFRHQQVAGSDPIPGCSDIKVLRFCAANFSLQRIETVKKT